MSVQIFQPPIVLILAGGAGTRFWPASTAARPKHVLPLLGGDRPTLLEATIERCLRFVASERIHVVTTPEQVEAVAPLCSAIPPQNLFLEPVPRNTAPAVALSLVALARRGAGPHDPVVVLPADAWVDDDEAFTVAIRRAVGLARKEKAIVTLGVRPDRAATGYGWIETGEPVAGRAGGDTPAHQVARFHEKPDRATAEGYLAAGNFRWNAGIFVARLGYFWYVIGDVREDLDMAMQIFGACLEEADQQGLATEYAKLESISFDHAVMEHASSVIAVEADFGWSDLGDWDGVAAALPELSGGVGRAERVLAEDARGNVVYAPEGRVALLGVEGLVVVSVGGTVLVAPRERAQEVRELARQAAEES